MLTLVLSASAIARSQERPRDCPELAVPFENGAQAAAICTEEARAVGYTVVDLSDDWVPRVLSEPRDATEALRQPYRGTYIALADERPVQRHEAQALERHLELFGVFPSLRVLREHVLDDARHACHDAVPDEPLAALDRTLSPWRPDLATQRARVQRMRKDERSLERGRERLQLADIDALESRPEYVYVLRRYRRDRSVVGAIESMQAHLVCSEYLSPKHERGVMDGPTAEALRTWQREHMAIGAGALDPAARALLTTDSRELVFRAALRVLRERVADATAVIEDGSATGRFGEVLGRQLDLPELRAVASYGALEGGAEDLLSPLTEAAARALGWTDPEGLARFFRDREPSATRGLRVALLLPELPAYHGPRMELRAELDRGDVWYGYPYRQDGSLRPMPVERRPTLVLFARIGDSWKPLARYLTTIGGWQREQTESGAVGMRYKESPVGARVWRDLVAAPVWLPPASTPDSELVQRASGSYLPKLDLLGPGYRSAYGLAMLVHVLPRPTRTSRSEPSEAEPDLFTDELCCIDQGVRTHGSVSYGSILRGQSHGCHRLLNHLALRLMGFLLSHRNHVRHGNLPVVYDRNLTVGGKALAMHVRSRGYRYELVPPVPIEVSQGRIRGPRQQPIRGLRPLREEVARSLHARDDDAIAHAP